MTYDIAIIGAGAAGIAAARTARALGKSFVVLEARQRVGGRAFTDTSLGIPYDAGAAYIHFADRNPWVREARRLGIETRLWRGWTHHEAWQGGVPLSDDQAAKRGDGYGEFWQHLELLGKNPTDRSISEAADHLSPSAREAARHFSRLALGEEPSRLSLQDYQVQWAGPDRVIPRGYGTLVVAAAEGLPIHLGVPVKRILVLSNGFDLETGKGTVRARAVIVTVSIGVLKAGHIAFEPGLPTHILRALDRLDMGALTKVALAFDGERFGLQRGDDKILLDAPGGSMTFEIWPFDRDIVIAVTGGDAGREISRLSASAAVEHVAGLFSTIIGRDCRPNLRGGNRAGWWSDPFAEGGYAFAHPGSFSARQALMETGIDGLYLAGEATAGGRFGATMSVGGASYAGWEAAKRAIQRLK